MERGKPSAVIVLANWAAQKTRDDMSERSLVKWNLTRRLYETGLSKKDVLELYRLVDWLIGLPEELEQDFKQQLREYEKSKVMPYVTSIERMAKKEGREEGWTKGLEKGLEKGREEGLEQGLENGRKQGRAEIVLRLLRRRWEPLPTGLEEQIRGLSLEQQANLAEALFDFTSLADLGTWLSAGDGRS
jgi:flagellar biosynthesis/type III secretory pathway protein FliH